ncbi:hypothetical protein N7478_009390 [Penicillium angulare]|uniref:uncharacterized protein n=1 Tax=Penicillium angulare TaxID=116970 RepID=UPI0025403490|nr:uncharacterized protein N7478_009390 [Penicillium angulare]KAJ5266582.1 hypothetical protein N7478_009390 [Penicillium angulare]
MTSARKPLRLRAACNQCYAAKLRCSGEKEGCDRCRRNGLSCEYQVSMVGRASKKRRPDSNYQIELEPPSQHIPDACVLGDLTGTVDEMMNDGHEPPFFEMGNFISYSTGSETDADLQTLLNDYPDLPFLSSGAAHSSTASEHLITGLHRDINETSSSEGISRTPGTQQITQVTPHIPIIPENQTLEIVRSRLAEQTDSRVPPVYRDRSKVSQYPHAAALMRIIEGLEEQLQISTIPIDQAMRLNRRAMAKIREVGDTEGFRQCNSCPLLVMTIMDLVLGLYELVIVSIHHPSDQGDSLSPLDPNTQNFESGKLSDTSRASPRSNISGDSGPPIFQFGCLEFDPDEQEMFRIALVRRDLRRCVETLQWCGNEVLPRHNRQVASLRGSDDGVSRPAKVSSGAVQTQWYQEMGHRAKEILVALPAKCGHQ